MKKYYGIKISVIDFVYERIFRVVERLEVSRRNALKHWHSL